MLTLEPSALTSTGWAGKDFEMSASKRPDTSARPEVPPLTSRVAWVETS